MQGRRLGERRVALLELRGALEQRLDDLVVETRTHVPGIAQGLAFPVAEEQGAQGVARALAARVAADQELAGLRVFDLEPGARAPARLVAAVEALGEDPLETVGDRGGIELLGVARGMHQLQVPGGQQALREVAPPVAIGRLAEVEPGKMEQIEADEHHRRVALRGGDLRGGPELRTVLQRVERGVPLAIQGDDLAVEDHPAGALRGEIRGQLGEVRCQIESPARLQPHARAVDESDHPVAVELRLIAPLRVGLEALAGLGEHRLELLRQRLDGASGREHLRGEARRHRVRRHFIECCAGEHRGGPREHVVGLGEAIAVLDEQPLVAGGRLHERKGALELLAAQLDAELPGCEPRAHPSFGFGAIGEGELAILVRGVHAAVPDDHPSGAVLLLRDHAFEGGVLEGMILDLDRHALVAGVERRTLGNGPGFQHPVELEAKVVMQPARRVLLHDEEQGACTRGRRLRGRLGRAREGALGGVALERAAAHCHEPIHSLRARHSSPRTSSSLRPLRAGTWKEWFASSTSRSVARAPNLATTVSSKPRSASASRAP